MDDQLNPLCVVCLRRIPDPRRRASSIYCGDTCQKVSRQRLLAENRQRARLQRAAEKLRKEQAGSPAPLLRDNGYNLVVPAQITRLWIERSSALSRALDKNRANYESLQALPRESRSPDQTSFCELYEAAAKLTLDVGSVAVAPILNAKWGTVSGK